MELPKERVIQLPRKLLEQCNGFSFDFGGSVVKICYLAKSDWENGCPGESEGPLRLRSFSREQLEESLEFIKNNAHIRRTHQNPKPVIYTTGIGGFQYGKLVEEKLDVTIENIGETDGFALTIESLVETKPLEEFCVPFDEEEAVAVRGEGSNFVKVFSDAVEKGHMQAVMNPTAKEELKKDYDRTSDLSTYCLGTFGSAWGCIKTADYHLHFLQYGSHFGAIGAILKGAEMNKKDDSSETSK